MRQETSPGEHRYCPSNKEFITLFAASASQRPHPNSSSWRVLHLSRKRELEGYLTTLDLEPIQLNKQSKNVGLKDKLY